MAYRLEKNSNGEQDLVIDGWEQGIADSPFKGIGNMRNVSIKYYEGVAYVNYKRIRINTAGGNQVFTGTSSPSQLTLSGALTLQVGDAVVLSTTGSLPTGLSPGTYFIQAINSGTGVFQVATTLGGSAVTITGAGSGVQTLTLVTMAKPKFYTRSTCNPTELNARVYILDSAGRVWQNSGTVNSLPYFQLLVGNTVDGATVQGLGFYSSYLVVFRNTAIDFCGTASGQTSDVNSSNWINGFVSDETVTVSGMWSMGDVAGDISAPWPAMTGTYEFTIGSVNQRIFISFTNGSIAATWNMPLADNVTGSISIHMTSPFASTHMALVSVNDGNLYFCNGQWVGAISTANDRIFDLDFPANAIFNAAALELPTYENSVWLSEIQQNLIVAGNRKIYPWDRVSTSWNNPVPLNEDIVRMTNILNNLYIFAGNKGDVYESNGYSIYPFKKMSDYITGTIDPAYSFGGYMAHRQRLWFTAFAQNSQTNAAILNGIFSLGIVSGGSTYTADTSGTLNMESQNSNGLLNASATYDALLIDDESQNYDTYYSAWYDGSTGGVDFNNTTLWSNNEAIIETDIIPVGTFLQNKTYSSMEFKLDQPMRSGDSITIYSRNSLSDTFTFVGTTNTATLSFPYTPLALENLQWIQFMITLSCNATATSSSFMRLREVRIR